MRKCYPHIVGLRPILDSIVWPEDAPYLPETFSPCPPGYCFLVSDAGVYYFFKFWVFELLRAGTTLEEVFNGMKEMKYAWMSHPKEDDWECEEECEEVQGDELPDFYFPRYRFDRVEGHWTLEQ
jgi:hypothetical protein